ncbi:MBL fold metallo-hydrolase [Halapricum desulfuricans]|uniref:Zn-dependent hydrolase of the beta-lactamase fold n=1 Tax=Halapricum desulfuricans TaxID=2841257 RepID=A0A897NAH7_9EURY|nr:MBL fold metallo-hydrolase [Halapricum desulfuricans]QSG08355.1 Zn-dependent hydrolase of the beta-lactamase fold [Halapricum desulfuricans]
MVHSDWGDWLPRAIEDADPEGVAIWYLGCNGFVLKADDGTTVFVDPYLGTGDPPRTVRMIPVPFDPEDVGPVDAVFATHEHTDHVHGESTGPILEDSGAPFYGPDDSLAAAREAGWDERWAISDDQFVEVSEGDTVELGSLTITVEPANDPDATHSVAYVFEHEAGTFVHGGDARPGAFEPVGENYDIDAAALAFGSAGMIRDKQTRDPKYTKWYNDENEIIEAANELQVETLVPTHWDMWKGLNADPTVLHHHARSFEYPEQVKVIEIGDRIDL